MERRGRKIFRRHKTSHAPHTVFCMKVSPGVGEVSSSGGLSKKLGPQWCHGGFWLPEQGSINQVGNGASLARGCGSPWVAH